MKVTPFVGVWIETRCRILQMRHLHVTPFVGVWIETPISYPISYYLKSHPSWVCGLKLDYHHPHKDDIYVTPFVGVWIETYKQKNMWKTDTTSHPSWVCGLKHFNLTFTKCITSHTLRGCVDWNRWLVLPMFSVKSSHPSWVCGLKLQSFSLNPLRFGSHPSWVCGLKQKQLNISIIKKWSHPSWVCGLKLVRHLSNLTSSRSHPSWVCGLKLSFGISFCDIGLSHPSWVCGLKHTMHHHVECTHLSHPSWVCGLKPSWPWPVITALNVTPFVGVWIETCALRSSSEISDVTPFVGVWIETAGLSAMRHWLQGHTLRGCVDWNKYWLAVARHTSVTPFVGVWIETVSWHQSGRRSRRHTLRGCVDWNFSEYRIIGVHLSSHPSWVCGLKHQWVERTAKRHSVTPFVGVWIETWPSVSYCC